MIKKEIILIVLSSLFIFACNSHKQSSDEEELTLTEEGMVVEPSDTAAVNTLVTQFMDYVMKKEYYQAAGMLYKADVDKGWEEPLPLDNDEIESMVKMLKAFPAYNYRIDYIKFALAEKNEVKCTIELGERVEGAPAPKCITWCFKPVRYLARWVLCMKDTGNGDKPIE